MPHHEPSRGSFIWIIFGDEVKCFCRWHGKGSRYLDHETKKQNNQVGTGTTVLQSKPWDAAVWANGAQGVDLVQPRSQERQPISPCASILPLSHYTRVLESWKNETRRVVCQVELQILLVECKVAGSIPERAVFFSRLNDPMIMIVSIQCAYSDACCVQSL